MRFHVYVATETFSSFVAPLTPVVKKYLDIQTGPSGIHPNAGQKQPSRPSSRTNNRVVEAGPRPASATLSRPPSRPATNDLAHNTRHRLPAHGHPTAVDIRAPRQRTMSQMQRDPPQPRNLHITGQSSSAAQRCVVPASAPVRQVAQHPPLGAARVLPAPSSTSTGRPQRPPPGPLKFNPPPPDRLKVTGNGAKRVPLPSVPVNGRVDEQVAAVADSGSRTCSIVDKPRSKLPGRNAEAIASGKLPVTRKGPEATRSTSSSTKPGNRSVPTGPAAVQRAQQRSVKGEISNPSRLAPERRPVGNTQKSTRPLTKAERKETSPPLIPLPPSPSPTEISLPPSPDCTSHPEVPDEPVVATPPGPIKPAEKLSRIAESCQEQGEGAPSTPITALLSSIQRGFLFTPSTPLSPPQNYLPVRGNFLKKTQSAIIMSDVDVTKGLSSGVPFCAPLEDDAADGLDRHALKDLN